VLRSATFPCQRAFLTSQLPARTSFSSSFVGSDDAHLVRKLVGHKARRLLRKTNCSLLVVRWRAVIPGAHRHEHGGRTGVVDHD
jgi:hypothetical protein